MEMRMMINVTNHPFGNWQDAMKHAAINQYGTVVDLPFPSISPQADRDEIETLATDYWLRIQEILLRNNLSIADVTIHLMGEFTFTYALLSLLEAAGIRAVASTSERNTVDLPDGSKNTIFNFVRFREYYTVDTNLESE